MEMATENEKGGVFGNTNTPMRTTRIVFVENELAKNPQLLSAVGNLEGATALLPFSEDVVRQAEDTSVKKQDRIVFVTSNFHAPLIQRLKKKCLILGPAAFLHFAETTRQLPIKQKLRPLYNTSMQGVVALFSNFNTDRLAHFVDLIHYMGGQVRDEYHKTGQSLRVTHLIAQWVQGLKYQTAVNMDIPIVGEDWVTFFWNHRDEPRLDATSKEHSVRFHVQPFHGLQIYLIGFEEEASIRTLIEEHGGKVVSSAAEASHIVVDSENKPDGIKVTCEELDQQRVVTVKWGDAPDSEESLLFTADQVLVKSEWFWTSIKIDNCANPDAHALLDLLSTSSSLRSADRKRKAPASPKDSPSRRRLSAVEERETSVGHASFDHSDESLQSSSGSAPLLASPLVSLPSKRQRTVLEMLDTERNYVKILSAILKINTDVYDVEQRGGALLDLPAATQMDEYMRKIPEILDVHTMIRHDLEALTAPWREDCSVGNIWLKYSARLEDIYPPFVNIYGKLKKHIEDCEKSFPRFRAFLMLAQREPEYGRQNLKDLLIRPVQRLPSVGLLLADLTKRTDEALSDHADLARASAEVDRVLTFINREKAAAEIEELIFNIDGAPTDLMANHRLYITRLECFELFGRQFHDRGTELCLILFGDALEVAKKRLEAGNAQEKKPMKHLEFIPLTRIQQIIDVSDEGDQVKGAFKLSISLDTSNKNGDYKFGCTLEYLPAKLKEEFLRALAKQVSAIRCSNVTVEKLRAEDAGIKTTDAPLTTWDRACKLPRTMSRRLTSIGKNSGQKLKRAMSSAFLTPNNGAKKGKECQDSDGDISPKKLFKR